MPFRIEIHELAHEEYINAYGWYEDKQVGLGALFMNEVERSLDRIGKHPLRSNILKSNILIEKVLLKTFLT